ncbi:MAG: ATP-binding cassette domain-containing protein [Planctomycetota bacterium]
MTNAPDDVLIHVRDLAIGYGGVAIQRELEFDVQRGQIYLLLGGSGTGKSTLLQHLIGLMEPLAGTIEGPGAPAGELAGRRPTSGVMFQGGALFSSLTLRENVAVPLETWTDLSPRHRSEVADARLRLVGLGGFENHLPSEISGGMKKRAAIARALALDAPLLFLDEPSAGLDPISAVELDDLLVLLRDDVGVTMVVVTHELESIFRVGDRCLLLDADARTAIAEGDPRRLRDESDDIRVRRFFHRLPAATLR